MGSPLNYDQEVRLICHNLIRVVRPTAATPSASGPELLKPKLAIADTVLEEGHKQCQTVPGGSYRLLRCVGLAAALGVLQGCSVLLLSAGLTSSDLPKLEAAKTRAELEAIAGEAVASTKTAEGNQLDVYKYLDLSYRAGTKSSVNDLRASCAFTAVLTFGIWEALCAPLALAVRSEATRKVYVTYALDGRVLSVDFDAGVPLRKSLWGQIQRDECPRWVRCVMAFWDELRQRATAVNYKLTAGDETLYSRALEIAGDVDGGRITKEEAIRRMDCLRQGVPKTSEKRRAIPVSADQVELVDFTVHPEDSAPLLTGRLGNRSALVLTDVIIKVSFYDAQSKVGEAWVGGTADRLRGETTGEKGISDMRVLPGEEREFAVRLEKPVPAHYTRVEFRVVDPWGTAQDSQACTPW